MSMLLLAAGVAVLATVTCDLLVVTIGGGTRLSLSVRLAAAVFRGLRAAPRRGWAGSAC